MNYKALLFSILLIPSWVFAQQSQPQNVRNIEAFAKLYGYVKYFHPSDEAFENDWDYFAIYGASKVLDCPDNAALRDSLNMLFQPIAPTIQISKSKKGYSAKNHIPKDTTDFKRIFWQHQGVAYGNFRNANDSNNPFQSVRVNKPYEVPVALDTAGFSVSLKIDSTWLNMPYRISGNLRFSKGKHHRMGYGDQGQFYAEIDHHRVHSEIQPGPYSNVVMAGRFPDQADSLTLGAVISGGILRVKGIEIKVKVDGVWKNIDAEVSKFDSQNTLAKDCFRYWGGDNYKIGISTDVDIQVLKIEGSEKYVKVDGQKLFDEEPQVSDCIQVELVDGVHATIPYVVYSNFLGTYPPGEGHGKLAIELENTSYNPAYVGSRLGNVINAWNVFKFSYPYIDLLKVDWDDALLYSIKSVINGASTTQGIEIMTHYLEDAGVEVSGEEQFYYPPILWERLSNGKLVVTYVGDEKSNLKPGYVVTSIDDQSVDRVYSDVYSAVSTFSEDARAHKLDWLILQGDQSSKVKLGIEKRGAHYIVREMESPVSLPDRDQSAVQWLDEGNTVLYFNWGLVANEMVFSQAIEQMMDADHVLLDFRDGIAAQIGERSIKRFLKKAYTSPESSQWMSVPRRIRADETLEPAMLNNADLWVERPDSLGFTGQMICLVDGGVKGMSESIIMALEKHQKDMTIVGEQSAGANGIIHSFILPGDITVSYSGVKTVKLDGGAFFGVGIMPDVKIENTEEAITSGRDLYIEKAMEYIVKSRH